jgi:hypothetical protein
MTNSGYKILAGLLVASLFITACTLFTTEPQPVTFQLSIPPDGFSPNAELRISLWDEELLAASEKIADCAISQDVKTGEEIVQCPEGVEYTKIEPETFSIPVSSLTQPLTIASKSVLTGEKYRLQISGLSQDNCNNASASYEGTARSAEIKLERFDWLTTEMACP